MSDLIVLCVVLFALQKIEKDLPNHERNRDTKITKVEFTEPCYRDRCCEVIPEDINVCAGHLRAKHKELSEHRDADRDALGETPGRCGEDTGTEEEK